MALTLGGLLPVVVAVAQTRPVPEQAAPVDMAGKDCTASGCHADLMTAKVLHGPVAQAKCQACHQQPDPAKHAFRYTHAEDKLCGACHVLQLKNFVHTPLSQGDCTGCHDPHGSEHRFLVRDDPAEKLCLRCHQDEPFMAAEHLHGPVAAGACILCHESHSSWNAKLVIRRGRELCLFCHEEVDRALAAARHTHEPVRDDCGQCHDPHGTPHTMQLRQEPKKLCANCHEQINKLIETSENVHGAVTTEDGCANCHRGHATVLPKLLKRSLMDTCLSCHDKEIEMPDGKKLADMATLLKNNPDHHGPVRRADCSSCHNPHASPNFRLLSKVYPKYFYAPFDLGNYDLCFQCHMRDMVLVKDGYGLTRFKDGTRNLHYVHVHKAEKGRTCRACHEVHASRNPAHIRNTVPFGPSGWEYELKFTKTENGGQCGPACHRAKEYVRADETHELPPPREHFPEPEASAASQSTKEANR